VRKSGVADPIRDPKLGSEIQAGFWIVRVYEMRENETDDPAESLFGPFATEDDAAAWMDRDDVIDWSEAEDAQAEYVNDIRPPQAELCKAPSGFCPYPNCDGTVSSHSTEEDS
jgi:hypothetical protein